MLYYEELYQLHDIGTNKCVNGAWSAALFSLHVMQIKNICSLHQFILLLHQSDCFHVTFQKPTQKYNFLSSCFNINSLLRKSFLCKNVAFKVDSLPFILYANNIQ